MSLPRDAGEGVEDMDKEGADSREAQGIKLETQAVKDGVEQSDAVRGCAEEKSQETRTPGGINVPNVNGTGRPLLDDPALESTDAGVSVLQVRNIQISEGHLRAIGRWGEEVATQVLSEWEDVREVKWVNAVVERCMPYDIISQQKNDPHTVTPFIFLKRACIKGLLKLIFCSTARTTAFCVMPG